MTSNLNLQRLVSRYKDLAETALSDPESSQVLAEQLWTQLNEILNR